MAARVLNNYGSYQIVVLATQSPTQNPTVGL